MHDVEFAFGTTEEAVDEERLRRFRARLDLTWSESLAANTEQRSAFRDRLGERYQPGLDAMVMLHVCAFEAAEWAHGAIESASKDDPDRLEFANYYEVVRGLFARTMLAFDEVTWLLRGGYPSGALTRVRTMQELVIIASVLAEHASPGADHPELVEMYVRHHEVFIRSVADELTATGALDPEKYFDADTLAALDAKRDELIGRYGKRFKSMFGWAGPLFPDDKPISMARLSGLVTTKLNYFYGLSSSHIHGGSQGWHENFVTRGDEVALACGPTNLGLVVPAQLATTFLLGMLEVAIPAAIRRDGHTDDTGAMFLSGIRRVAERAIKALSAAEERVAEEERACQAQRRNSADT
ncbi:DUF5677 domain-containing protein [Micromonospora sp. NPDC005324]|uniref:DUF5677 domain-containing protein n=1 Tax=Micromonospora sp. NPDC005324 TaxID=3157033 RepID=UPI0033A22976